MSGGLKSLILLYLLLILPINPSPVLEGIGYSPLSPLVYFPASTSSHPGERALYASNNTIIGDGLQVVPLLLWTRLYLEMVMSFTGDLVAPTGYGGSPVPVWLENPASQPLNQVKCYGIPRTTLPTVASATGTASLQTAYIPGSNVGASAPTVNGFLASAQLAIAQPMEFKASAMGASGSMRVYGTYPYDGSGGVQTQLQLTGLSIPFAHGAFAAAPGSPRVRLLMELWVNGPPPTPYTPSEQPAALADAQGSLSRTLVSSIATLATPTARYITSDSGPVLLYQYVEEVPDLTVDIYGSAGVAANAAGVEGSTYRALFPLWPALPLASPTGTSPSLPYVWLGGTTMVALGLQYTLVLSLSNATGNAWSGPGGYPVIDGGGSYAGRAVLPFSLTTSDPAQAYDWSVAYGYTGG